MRTSIGKTTTMGILAALLRPDGGRAAVLGHDVVRDAGAVRRRIAVARDACQSATSCASAAEVPAGSFS